VNDIVPTQEQGRRAYFNEHGHWPRSTPKYSVSFTRRDAPTKAPATPPAPRDSLGLRPCVPATPVPFAPLGAVRTPEQEAWSRAYSGPEVGPLGASWPEDSTGYSRFMVWRLEINKPTEFRRPSPPRS
jgi:hypothetical protein